MWSAPRGQKQLHNLAAKGWFLHLGSEELGKLMGKPGNNPKPQFETNPLVILSHVQPWITSNLGLWLVKTECLVVVRLLPKYRQQSHTAPRLCFVKFSCLMVALMVWCIFAIILNVISFGWWHHLGQSPIFFTGGRTKKRGMWGGFADTHLIIYGDIGTCGRYTKVHQRFRSFNLTGTKTTQVHVHKQGW